jgi:hypothetical protein
MHPVPGPASGPARPPEPGAAVDLTRVPIPVPAQACGLLVTAADRGRGGALEGLWLTDPDWAARYDEDVVATLAACSRHDAHRAGIHLEAYLVHDGAVLHLGSWCALGPDWPETLRAPASAAVRLHTDLLEAGHRCRQHIEP